MRFEPMLQLPHLSEPFDHILLLLAVRARVQDQTTGQVSLRIIARIMFRRTADLDSLFLIFMKCNASAGPVT
jgi:hypothetical protein